MATAMLGDFRNCLDSATLNRIVGKFHINIFNQNEIMAAQVLLIPFYKKTVGSHLKLLAMSTTY